MDKRVDLYIFMAIAIFNLVLLLSLGFVLTLVSTWLGLLYFAVLLVATMKYLIRLTNKIDA